MLEVLKKREKSKLIGQKKIDKFSNKIYMCFLGMILGTIVTYIFGTAWLSYQANRIAMLLVFFHLFQET